MTLKHAGTTTPGKPFTFQGSTLYRVNCAGPDSNRVDTSAAIRSHINAEARDVLNEILEGDIHRINLLCAGIFVGCKVLAIRIMDGKFFILDKDTEVDFHEANDSTK